SWFVGCSQHGCRRIRLVANHRSNQIFPSDELILEYRKSFHCGNSTLQQSYHLLRRFISSTNAGKTYENRKPLSHKRRTRCFVCRYWFSAKTSGYPKTKTARFAERLRKFSHSPGRLFVCVRSGNVEDTA